MGLVSYHFETTTTTAAAAALNVEPASSAAASASSSSSSLSNDNMVVTAAYISYEHSAAVTIWPPLDNGRPIPARMYLTNIELTDDGTVFRGTIDWMGTHHTTWGNTTIWTYEIRFDDKFQCVVGGVVRCRFLSSEHNCNSGHDDDDDDVGVGVPQQQQQQSQQDVVVSEFGPDLVYLNAAVYSYTDDDHDDDDTRRQQQFSVDHIQSCGATAPTILALQSALQRPAKPHSYLS
jgi:hypothetical protein